MATSASRSANLQLNINQAPYYDDFWESANTPFYVQTLFRPGYAVQARELSQIQSTVIRFFQNLGDFLMEEKSPMINGDFTLSTTVKALKLASGENANLFIDRQVTGQTSSAQLTVKAVAIETSGGDPPTIVGTLDSGTFTDGETIETVTKAGYSDYTASLAASSATASSSIVSVDEGHFYLRGLPLAANAQTIILDKYDNTPSYRIGLTVRESFVNSALDTTLLDNAQGTDNFAAPGANRYRIKLDLDKKEIDSGTTITDTDYPWFYEYMRVIDGSITDEITDPILDPNIITSVGTTDLNFVNNVLQLKTMTAAQVAAYAGANGEPVFEYENNYLYIWYDGTEYKIGDGANAAFLEGQPGSYYLDYDKLTNKPTNISTWVNDVGYITSVSSVSQTSYVPATDFWAYTPDYGPGNESIELSTIDKISSSVGPKDNSGYFTQELLPFKGREFNKTYNGMIVPPPGIDASDIDVVFFVMQRIKINQTLNITSNILLWSMNDGDDIGDIDTGVFADGSNGFWDTTTGAWSNKTTITIESSFSFNTTYTKFFKHTESALSTVMPLGGSYTSGNPIFFTIAPPLTADGSSYCNILGIAFNWNSL